MTIIDWTSHAEAFAEATIDVFAKGKHPEQQRSAVLETAKKWREYGFPKLADALDKIADRIHKPRRT